ncbi:UbiE1 [Desulfamplus magnetovallimortis]|uniref:UbiE1 n=1 Tax=Desulfamplus magnetovallimortis TaxID=1246637 RepID=A0A1W1HDP4_9BACT|nr:fibrillarin-like rRNA/tRNA 2'-O-methyltransferase [Desulfamplus magnetovallimortis]SLM30553.1 UbiE1 [Desulfamplus magnetovallimortis]
MDNTNPKNPKGAGKSSFELIDSNILLKNIPIKEGAVVLDLACGKGTYSLYLSDVVGEKGLVYAVDLWKEGIQLLGEKIDQKSITNIVPLIADATQDIEIDEYSIDICLMATVLHDFHEIDKAAHVLKTVKTLLRPNGHLAVIEFKKIDGPPGPPINIRLSEEETETLVTKNGFKKIKSIDIGEYNYLMTFQPE